MKSEREKKVDREYLMREGRTQDEEDLSRARMLPILFFVTVAICAGLYYWLA